MGESVECEFRQKILHLKYFPPSVIDASPTPPVSGSSNEKEDDPEETVADDFEGENENEFELLQEHKEGVRSLFDLFEQKLL